MGHQMEKRRGRENGGREEEVTGRNNVKDNLFWNCI